MITLIDALNFRCLRDVQQSLKPFEVLVGPNASGKTTFLDVVAFLGRIVSTGLEGAVAERTSNPQDLVWSRHGDGFEIAIEADIPEDIRPKLADPAWDTIRYEVGITAVPELEFRAEKVSLHTKGPAAVLSKKQLTFPHQTQQPRQSLLTASGAKSVVTKVIAGGDTFSSEVPDKKWKVSYKLGRLKSALGNLPEDESKFPATTWLKSLLTEGVQQFVLNSLLIRRASPPGQGGVFKMDGSNIPWVIWRLEQAAKESGPDADRLESWIQHLRTALPDLQSVRTVERPDDRHRYLMLKYDNGIEVPSWMASDGTLRLMALTLPAYVPDFRGVYLIEEPENGIHPKAVETMYQSLSSVYNAQILLASHSPVVLNLTQPEDVLCFSKDASGATDIVRGSDHPMLRDWHRETSLGDLLAAGVLG